MAKSEQKVNVIIQRRLAFFPQGGTQAARNYLAGKVTVEELADQYNISTTQALFAVRQHAVEAGLVKSMNLDATDQKAVQAAHGNGEHADWAWLACRAGVTPQRLQFTAKGDTSARKSTAASRTESKPSTGSKSRRSSKKQPVTA